MKEHTWVRTVGAALCAALLCAIPAPAVLADADPPRPTSQHAPTPAPEPGPGVNLNTASADELARLPGIGQHKAEAIVARRDKKKFSRPDELMDVKGIGRGLYKRCKPFVRLSGPTTLTEKVRATRRESKP